MTADRDDPDTVVRGYTLQNWRSLEHSLVPPPESPRDNPENQIQQSGDN